MKKVQCHACMKWVIPIKAKEIVMRHQEKYVSGFTLFKPVTECPECGERRI